MIGVHPTLNCRSGKAGSIQCRRKGAPEDRGTRTQALTAYWTRAQFRQDHLYRPTLAPSSAKDAAFHPRQPTPASPRKDTTMNCLILGVAVRVCPASHRANVKQSCAVSAISDRQTVSSFTATPATTYTVTRARSVSGERENNVQFAGEQ